MTLKQDQINKNFMEKLDQLNEKINEVYVKLAGLPEEMAKKFDNRYAAKRTEVVVDRLAWLVISTIVGAIMLLVLKTQL